jgi:HD-GYP domain-containing protein (c-di-GMP phosphodiesterase class II)
VASYPEDLITKGIDLVELADNILSRAKEAGGNRVYSTLDAKKEKVIAGRKNGKETANVKFLKDKIDKLNKRASQTLIESIFAFAKAIELKDRYTGKHVEMTVRYATNMAKKLNLTKEEIEDIRQAAILHDLGKIGISEKILLKKDTLTKVEFEEIKKHPQIGVDIIRPLHFLHSIIPLMLYHHERWDGKGYPHGLKEENIPIGARIIAVADVYQALISTRPYRKAFSQSKAVKIIKENSGSQFDPKIVDIFLTMVKKGK